MAKGTNIRYPEHIRQFLELESERLGVPLSEIAIKTLDDAIKGNPILTAIVDLDKEIKQEKLQKLREETIKLKDCNEHFKKYGYYPTKPASFVTRVVEQIPQSKKYPTIPQSTNQHNTELQLTDQQWNLVLPTLTEFDEIKKSYYCVVKDCVHGCQKIETAKQHIIDNHESLLLEHLRGLTN